MEWVESTGVTIEEAKENALDRLGVHEDDAEFEVVADVKTGLFGRLKEAARVRARVRPTTPRPKDEARRRGRGSRSGGLSGGGRSRGGGSGGDDSGERSGGSAEGAGPGDGRRRRGESGNLRNARASGAEGRKNRESDGGKDRGRNKKEGTKVTDDQPSMTLREQAELAEDFVRGLAEKFGTNVEFRREDVAEDEIRITVSGNDLGRMVGRRGTTAGAIDELVRTVLQRRAGSGRNGRIRVDIGGVRARRTEALTAFSRQQAAEVRDSGKARALEPMVASDRKVIHDAVNEEDGVDTISEGEDPYRRVVIVPAGASD